jgi:uracil-DNA glycosylase family 4
MLMREPAENCSLCPRLAAFRTESRAAEPTWHNAPVPGFGPTAARLLVVGLAPGLKGANRTGRPFTGDHAGDLLYETLALFGFAHGRYLGHIDDGLRLDDCFITNAVRCVPPANKPTVAEIAACRPFLKTQIEALPELRAIVALGRIAHDSILRGLQTRPAGFPFAHGARHELFVQSSAATKLQSEASAPCSGSALPTSPLVLFDSYHCSRYNTNTGVLTGAMFRAVFAGVRQWLDETMPGSAGTAGLAR